MHHFIRILYDSDSFHPKRQQGVENVEFISVPEAMEKYSLTRDQLYHYVKTYKKSQILKANHPKNTK